EEKRVDNREKAMLLFTFQLLLDKGYVDTAASLASEFSLSLDQYTICENIDLNSIFIDFEAYYNMRFQRYPQYFKKISAGGATVGESLLMKLSKKNGGRNNTGSSRLRRGGPMADGDLLSANSSEPLELNISNNVNPRCCNNEKLLKPISGLEFGNDEMRYFADIIQREIVVQDLETKWDDIIGLENAKMILMESMVYRNEFTEFFGDALPPWKGLLLYGPVGTGKTMLARAVASECGTTFFNISTACLVSKWRGDSEKMMKVLFDLARYHAPSTIFFDEFDALASNRDTSSESDASRRLKSELLQQMDGLLTNCESQPPVFILAATNLPWELDPAVVRRLEKRVYIPVPNTQERAGILKHHFAKTAQGVARNSKGKNSIVCNLDFEAVANATVGYSGSDLQHVVKEAVVLKFRETFQDKSKLRKLIIDSQDVARALKNVSSTVKAEQDKKFKNLESSFTT
ncbi:hypothetical protein Fcan01_02823, partial [Folsomia candida]